MGDNMYYTVEHNNNDYKIKVKYDDKNKKYSIKISNNLISKKQI